MDVLPVGEELVEALQRHPIAVRVQLFHQVVVLDVTERAAHAHLEAAVGAERMHVVPLQQDVPLVLGVAAALVQRASGLAHLGQGAELDVVVVHPLHIGGEAPVLLRKVLAVAERELPGQVGLLLVLGAVGGAGDGAFTVQVAVDQQRVVVAQAVAVHAAQRERLLRGQEDVRAQLQVVRPAPAGVLAFPLVAEQGVAGAFLEGAALPRCPPVGESVAGEEVHVPAAVVQAEAEAVVVRVARGDLEAAVEPVPLLLLEHDVDDAHLALRIVARAGVGDHLHLVDQVALQHAQRIGAADADQAAGLAVDQDAHVLAAAQAHVPLHVHAHAGHVVQHIGGGAPAHAQVLVHVEHALVQLQFHLAPRADHLHLVHADAARPQHHGTQVGEALLHGGGQALLGEAQEADLHRIAAGGHGHAEAALLVGDASGDQNAVRQGQHSHVGIGDRSTSVIGDAATHTAPILRLQHAGTTDQDRQCSDAVHGSDGRPLFQQAAGGFVR